MACAGRPRAPDRPARRRASMLATPPPACRRTPPGNAHATEASRWLFTVASPLLIATPGQDMILAMSRSVAQGPAAGRGHGGRRQHRPRRPRPCSPRLGLGRDPARLGAPVRRAQARGRGLSRVAGHRAAARLRDADALVVPTSAARSPPRTCSGDGALSNLSNPKIAVFCPGLPAAVRPARGGAPHRDDLRAGARPRAAHLRGRRGSGGAVRGPALGLAARPSAGAAEDAPVRAARSCSAWG
ncbi:MAG: hypothetical protein MZW92_58050 [Comamonadaceae bacterium]|nr:hypothetical protein [Comamonadaceae bacterium]